MEEAFQIPVFLYMIMYTMFSSAIPILIILWILTVIVKSVRKLIRTILK